VNSYNLSKIEWLVLVTGTVHIAQEALAGLASKENFSNVQLRKTDSFGSSTPGSTNLPYKSLMLMQVKGQLCGSHVTNSLLHHYDMLDGPY